VPFSMVGITGITTAQPPAQPTAAERRGRAMVVVAVLIVLIAVVAAVALSRVEATAQGTTPEQGEQVAALSDDELGVDDLLAKARIAKREGRTEDAIVLYQKAIEKDPERPEIREELG